MRKLVYYVASSTDGFIADEHGDVSMFPVHPEAVTVLFTRYPETCPVHLCEGLGVTDPPKRFDTVLMGRKTYEPALQAGLVGGAYPHLRQIVVSHDPSLGNGAIEIWDDDVAAQVEVLKHASGRDIWLCGGGNLAGQLLTQIDVIEVKVNPVHIGAGVRIFDQQAIPPEFRLQGAVDLPGGVLLKTYHR